MPYESRLHFKEEFHKPVNYSACKHAEGQQPLGHLPSSLLLEEQALLGNAKLGRQSVGVTAVFAQEQQRLCPTTSAQGSK